MPALRTLCRSADVLTDTCGVIITIPPSTCEEHECLSMPDGGTINSKSFGRVQLNAKTDISTCTAVNNVMLPGGPGTV